jgi:hypothetical protein
MKRWMESGNVDKWKEVRKNMVSTNKKGVRWAKVRMRHYCGFAVHRVFGSNA